MGAEAGTPQVQEVSEGKNSLTVLEWVPSLPFLVAPVLFPFIVLECLNAWGAG